MQTEFRISGRWRMHDPTKHLQMGAKRVTDFFRARPHSVLAVEDNARKMLLGALWGKLLCFSFGLVKANIEPPLLPTRLASSAHYIYIYIFLSVYIYVYMQHIYIYIYLVCLTRPHSGPKE